MPFSPKREKRVKLREEELHEKCKKKESLKKQEQMHQEQVKKHEHNLEQQKMMLQDVQLRLESVSLEVKALRALVVETKEPDWPPSHAPLPCPREPPPGDAEQAAPIIHLDMAAAPLDSGDDDMEEWGVEPWRTVASSEKKRNKVVMELKGTPASSKRGSFRSSLVDKSCIIEGDMSGREVGEALPGRHY